MTYVIGLISGTSVDGIDAALIDISGTEFDLKVELLAGATYPYPAEMRERILAVCAGKAISMAELAELDDAIAIAFAQAAQNIQIGHETANLIGSHGQTVYHRPAGVGDREMGKVEAPLCGDKGQWGDGEKTLPYHPYPTGSPSGSQSLMGSHCVAGVPPVVARGVETPKTPLSHRLRVYTPSPHHRLGYTLQLGRGAVIAQLTGITTVSNFRVADIAAGGQGAPLVSPVDAALLSHPQEACCIQNIGGIGNVTYIPPRGDNWLEKIRGWDTGPGNSLLDLAVQYLTNGAKTYDENGSWAASGTPCHALVEQWLQQEYFHLPPPKSTGRELFGFAYLQQCIKDAESYQLSPADLLATLTELTAASIVHSYRSFLLHMPQRVFLCGGGSRNLYLKHRLQQLLTSVPVLTTDEVGLSADFKEAIAFAVLAYWRQLGIPGNLPSVTGAAQRVLLGEVNLPIC